MAAEPEPPLTITVEQAAACIESVYNDAPYAEAIRLGVGARMRRDEQALEFWRQVAELLGFDRKKRKIA